MPSAIVVALLLQAGPAVPVDLQVHDRLRTYAIHGRSAADLAQQMRRLGPADGASGPRFAAWTSWHVAWNYRYARAADGCRIATATVELERTMTLPEWADAAAAPPALQIRWRDYLEHLRGHEDGHREHGLQAAQAISRVIEHVGRAPQCRTLGAQIDAFADAVVARQAWADRDYDARTRHGRTQGAQWP